MTNNIFLKPILIFSKFFSSIFVQLPILDWPPIFQNLLTDIFADILKYYG